MPGLIERTGGEDGSTQDPLEHTRASWEASMLAQLDTLRTSLRLEPPSRIAWRCGAALREMSLELAYWGEGVTVEWPALIPLYPDGKWIGFRELPGGGFYHQAFQGYTGDQICREFEAAPAALGQSAAAIGGW